jgi:HK97 family phage major capsid protein
MNRDTDLIRKANDFIVNDLSTYGGLLQPETYQKFFQRAIPSSEILTRADVETMKKPRKLLPAMKFAARFLHAGQEGVALSAAQADKPTLTQPELNAHLLRGYVPITDEALEDNIETKSLVNTMLEILPEVVARDMDELILAGDTSASVPGDLDTQQYYQTTNGLIKQASIATANGGGLVINIDQLEAAIAALAVEYKTDARYAKMKWFVPVQARHTYQNQYAHRMTPGGDALYVPSTGAFLPGYKGAEIVGVPMMPVSNGLGTALLCDPMNIKVGIWRQVSLKVWRDELAGMNYVICTLRFDVTYQDAYAVAKLTNFAVAN